MASIYHKYQFMSSLDLDVDVKVFISHLRCAPGDTAPSDAANWYISARILSHGVSLSISPCCTSVPHVHGDCICWYEWLTLPLKYRELQRLDCVVRACRFQFPRASLARHAGCAAAVQYAHPHNALHRR